MTLKLRFVVVEEIFVLNYLLSLPLAGIDWFEFSFLTFCYEKQLNCSFADDFLLLVVCQ